MQTEELIQQPASKKVFPLTRGQRRFVILASLLVGDFTAVIISFYLAYQLRFIILDYPSFELNVTHYQQVIGLALPIWMVLFWVYQLYSTKVLFGGLEEYTRLFNTITTGAVTLIVIDFMFHRHESISRGWLIALWVIALLLCGGFRFAFRHWVFFLRRHGHLLTPAVIVNADGEGLMMLEQLKQWHNSGLRVRGFLDERLPIGKQIQEDITILARCDDLEEIIKTYNIEEVIVATGSLNREQLVNIYRIISGLPEVKLRFSSGLFEMISTGLHIKEMAHVPLIEVNKVRIMGLNALLKSIMDYVGAAFLLVFLSPFYAVISLLIHRDSPGPVIYKHQVIGLNGELFNAYKFRTMHNNGNEVLNANPILRKKFEENFKLKDDPRITRIGRFLRRTSLDEMPQLLNVLMGQMSLVGPRFISPPEIHKYGKWGMNLFTVKPGLTGLWQISGRSDVNYEERIRLDMYYIRNWTIWLDIYILLSTIPAVLSRKGAY